MATEVRAKMRLQNVRRDNDTQITLQFYPVALDEYPEDGSDPNNTYARHAPQAFVSMSVRNPDMLDKFKEGDEYDVTFTPR